MVRVSALLLLLGLPQLAHAQAAPHPGAGKITVHTYSSPVSTKPQQYAVYLPPDYDASKSYPLYVALHGGSSNGNLFLGVLLGNNLPWKQYRKHLRDTFVPRWKPDWIIVAPNGFGQLMWRWMGERDVLDVIDEVGRKFSVDPRRIVLGGLSNGGVGAYAIGTRHAWRFAEVHAMAGAPSWRQYLRSKLDVTTSRAVAPWSATDLAENGRNTVLRYFHGKRDTGPMRPAYVRAFTKHLKERGLAARETWYDLGHDILARVHRRGRLLASTTTAVNASPSEVTVVTADYRANRQHWLSITRIADYPSIARAKAKLADANTIVIDTDGVDALKLHVDQMKLTTDNAKVSIDGNEVFAGPVTALAKCGSFVKTADRWRHAQPKAIGKRPGLSGPITDAYYDRLVHVYGTQTPKHTDALKKTASRAARGWPLWGWDIKQEVVPDTALSPAQIKDAHLVLYGAPGDNRVLDEIASKLPITVDSEAVVVGEQRFTGTRLGVRFVYPNPLNPKRYVIVQSGQSLSAVSAGNRLPEFVPDYVVFVAAALKGSQRRIFDQRRPPIAQGYFNEHWQLD